MAIDLDSLNENQRKAVLWQDGPLLVLAGPGSGKTLVLTLRVARLLGKRRDASVLALTFTTKAAAEMRERVDRLLGQRGDRAHLCTFHSFATDILRQHGSHLGLRPDFSLLTQIEDRIAILDGIASNLADEGHLLPTDRKNLLDLVDRLFAESYDGGPEAPSLIRTPAWVPLMFAAYCDALVAANRLDFGSLLHFTRRLLLTQRGVARVLRVGWTHVCVDEFQDTNKAQYDLLRLLVAETQPNLFVVGDDDQIIYQWNGASPERLHALRRDYKMEVVQLPENYRCPPEIIGLANKLIVHNCSAPRIKNRSRHSAWLAWTTT
jgi:DNA helicase-2/ATP-dependent DNA helicase PcrA